MLLALLFKDLRLVQQFLSMFLFIRVVLQLIHYFWRYKNSKLRKSCYRHMRRAHYRWSQCGESNIPVKDSVKGQFLQCGVVWKNIFSVQDSNWVFHRLLKTLAHEVFSVRETGKNQFPMWKRVDEFLFKSSCKTVFPWKGEREEQGILQTARNLSE